MNITDKQIDYISKNLTANGITSIELKDDIIDHICSAFEANNSQDFKMVYKKIVNEFGGYDKMKRIQKETDYTLRAKKMLKARKASFVITFAMIALLLIGILFKIMHWPLANIFCVTALGSLILISLPLFIYQSHLKSSLQIQSK
ncbi:hypothetical protein [Pontimicrobium sp. MEBiC01747]